MDHLPINHRLRPFWRVLAFLTGVYVLGFGVFGYLQTKDSGLGTFARDDLPTVLGLQTNPAFAMLSIAVGAVTVLAVIVGRNVDFIVDFVAGSIFLLAGMAMLGLLHTDLNYLGFTVATCNVSFVVGLVLLTAGLYGRVGPEEAAEAEEERRHRVVGSNQGVVGDA
ncbi:MAG: DUF4383 domain-containing protein [Stackebrandtia sp.]